MSIGHSVMKWVLKHFYLLGEVDPQSLTKVMISG